MEEFITTWLGDLGRPVCGAIGILTATVLTQLVKLLGNAKTWGPLVNPLAGRDTNRLMPAVALGVGMLYGWAVVQDVTAGLTYGAGSIAAFMVFKRTLLGQ